MTDVLLLRHGQASAGASDYDNLSALGRTQSRALGGWLRDRGARPTHVLIGPRKRHLQTWEELSAGCTEGAAEPSLPEPLVWDDLDEHHGLQFIALGMAEFLERKDAVGDAARRLAAAEGTAIKPAYIELILRTFPMWVRGEIGHPDVESWEAFMERSARIEPRLLSIRNEHPAPKVWLVSSAGLISAVAARLLGAEGETALELMWTMRNTSITELGMNRVRSAVHPGLSLFSWNAVPHLSPETVSLV